MVIRELIIDPAKLAAIAQRFWRHVVCVDSPTDTCWHWLSTQTKGYGSFSLKGHQFKAHRVAWVLTYGSIDPALTVDHLCRNRACVNPAHLELVTNRVNILRGESLQARNARKNVCIHGHPLNEENTRIRRNGWRDCRVCSRDKHRRVRGSNPEARNAQKHACIHGHALTAENTYIRPYTGRRECRVCIQDRLRQSLARRRRTNV